MYLTLLKNSLIMETLEIKKVKNYFKKDWWKNFEDDTNNFTTHSVQKNVFNNEQLAKLRNLAVETIKIVTQNSQRLNDTASRVWVNGKYNEDVDVFFKENPITKDQDIETWVAQTFKEEKFGMFMNYVTSHNEELQKEIYNYIKPYINNYGIPLDGVSATIILGNYGWTPLGIHNDKRGEYIVHFHLGPGDKDMYIWEEEKAKKKGFVHRKKVEDVEGYMADYDEKYSFSAGDVFSMPGRCVHIGNTEGFSIGLVVELNGYTAEGLSKRLSYDLKNELLSQNYKGDKAIILPPYTPEDHNGYRNFLMEHILYNNINTNLDLKDSLRNIWKAHKSSLFSNSSFRRPPFLDQKKLSSTFKEEKSKNRIKVKEGYNIVFYEEGKNMNIYIRGRKVSLRKDEELLTFLELLNTKKVIDISSLKEFKKEKINKFVEILYKHSGIELY